MKMQSAVEEYLVEIEVRKYTPEDDSELPVQPQSLFAFLRREIARRDCRGAHACSCAAVFTLHERGRAQGHLYQWRAQIDQIVHSVLL